MAPGWYIRYFAATDDSPTGIFALEYLKSLLRIAPVRLVSTTGGLGRLWNGCDALFITTMTPSFVNVVCCEPSRWSWLQTVAAAPGRQGSGVSGRVELYTVGVRNVLLATTPPPADADQVASAMRYEAMVVPTIAIWDAWRAVGRVPVVVPTPVALHHNLHDFVMGAA